MEITLTRSELDTVAIALGQYAERIRELFDDGVMVEFAQQAERIKLQMDRTRVS